MTRLDGKIAIVTGASDGAGASVAARFGAEGAAVVVTYATDAEAAGRVVADITAGGGRALAIQGDVSNSEDVKRIFRITADAFGKAHIVVNNAGILRSGAMETDKPNRFDINVFGTFLMCQEAARQFDQGGGLIINMSSTGDGGNAPDRTAYSTTKGVVETLTLGLSFGLGPCGVRVVAIDPSDFQADAPSEPGITEEIMQHAIRLSPWRRCGTPADVTAFIKSKPLVVSTGWRGW
jgi:3-oxoacyl-[acyl-carrier protein] reductase